MHHLQKQERDEIAEWLIAQDFTVFGTLKFTDGTSISREHGDKIVRTYFNALDRTYFGHAVGNSNVRHQRVVFVHTGISGTNLHLTSSQGHAATPSCSLELPPQSGLK